MEAQIRIGHTCRFKLKQALLIYRDDSAAFATLHEVQGGKDQAPYLGPGQALSLSFLRSLARGRGREWRPRFCLRMYSRGRRTKSFGGARRYTG